MAVIQVKSSLGITEIITNLHRVSFNKSILDIQTVSLLKSFMLNSSILTLLFFFHTNCHVFLFETKGRLDFESYIAALLMLLKLVKDVNYDASLYGTFLVRLGSVMWACGNIFRPGGQQSCV